MREVSIRKVNLHELDEREDLKDMTPEELIGMMRQLTLDAWGFKGDLDAEPRMQKHIVVLKKRDRRTR